MPANSQNLLDALRRLATAQSRMGTVAARAAGINPTSWAILSELALDGDLTNGQIAARLGMSTGGVTPALDRLERGGLAQRRPNPGDRRSSIISITPAGSELLDQTHQLVADRLVPSLDELSERDRDVVDGVLGGAGDAFVEVHRELSR